MARASYSATPLVRSLVHRPQGVILVIFAYPDIALTEVRPDLGNYSGRNDAVSRRPRDRSA